MNVTAGGKTAGSDSGMVIRIKSSSLLHDYAVYGICGARIHTISAIPRYK